jgi:hypothetical protein
LRFDLGFELAYGMRFPADSDDEADFQSGWPCEEPGKAKNRKQT